MDFSIAPQQQPNQQHLRAAAKVTTKPASAQFSQVLQNAGLELFRKNLTTVQINLGKLCNQTCVHCHVDAGPHRVKENMNAQAVDKVIQLLESSQGLTTVDLTGGAPELNPNFRRLVNAARTLGLQVIDRCNLTVLFEPGQETLAEFLREHEVHIVASLPCYTSKNLEEQRGVGVFAKSIAGLQRLNKLGYGAQASPHTTALKLDLVYNPGGAYLPPEQSALEADYRTRLAEDFGISFSNLFALTNLPVKRFTAYLKQHGKLEEYNALLIQNFNPATVENLMCRSLISIGWDGKIFDCDFNQMEEIPIPGAHKNIWELTSFNAYAGSSDPTIQKKPIAVGAHCFGCTAGRGSSCQGEVAS